MVKIISKEVSEIVIVVVKSYYHILVLSLMMTVRWGFSAVKNAVAMVNDHWLAIILSTVIMFNFELIEININLFFFQ